MRVGVLALQGSFEKHAECLRFLEHSVLLVKKPDQLQGLDLLVMPGGESTSMLKLLSPEFRTTLTTFINNGLSVFATCAGLILLANVITNPKQESLALLDISIERNAYGSQVDSHVLQNLTWTFSKSPKEGFSDKDTAHIEAIQIRAPKITRIGKDVEVLVEHNGNPLLVKKANILGATFHPELSEKPYHLYSLILKMLPKATT